MVRTNTATACETAPGRSRPRGRRPDSWDRSTCSIGWPIPKSVASEKAATSSASRSP